MSILEHLLLLLLLFLLFLLLLLLILATLPENPNLSGHQRGNRTVLGVGLGPLATQR